MCELGACWLQAIVLLEGNKGERSDEWDVCGIDVGCWSNAQCGQSCMRLTV